MTDQLDRSAVEAVAELALVGAVAANRMQEVKGRHFALDNDGRLQRVDLEPELPEPVMFHTLAGFCGFLEAAQEVNGSDTFVHVVSPTVVECLGQVEGTDDHLRACHARAVYDPSTFPFGQQLDLERMHILLQTGFHPAHDREDLRRFISSVRSTSSVGVADDGVSQTVEGRKGIAAVDTVSVRNPWTLAPWRTFPEVVQPASPFILRFHDGEQPRAALWETGDRQWYLDAVGLVAEHLTATLGVGWSVLG